jgi:hypothetical protein
MFFLDLDLAFIFLSIARAPTAQALTAGPQCEHGTLLKSFFFHDSFLTPAVRLLAARV